MHSEQFNNASIFSSFVTDFASAHKYVAMFYPNEQSVNLVPEIDVEGNEGKSTSYIFVGSSLAGVFCLSDACRTGVHEAIRTLKAMGIKSVMLTGDSYAAARHVQEQVPIHISSALINASIIFACVYSSKDIMCS